MTSPMPEAKPGKHEEPPGRCGAIAMFDGGRCALVCVRTPRHGQNLHEDPVFGEWMLTMVPSAAAQDTAVTLAAVCPGSQP